jgi:hypothetical protein
MWPGESVRQAGQLANGTARQVDFEADHLTLYSFRAVHSGVP